MNDSTLEMGEQRFDPDVAALSTDIERLLSKPQITRGLQRALRLARKELAVYSAHRRGLDALGRIGLPRTARRVQIGGGSRLLEGFVNVDVAPPADVIFDVREGLPFPNGGTDLVFAEHFLEHIDYPVSVKSVMAECYRVLKAEGQLILGVPDARAVMDGYAVQDEALRWRLMHDWYRNRDGKEHFDTWIDVVNLVFRDQDDSDRYTPHLWAYDFQKLEELCAEAGFSRTAPWRHNPDIANPEREWCSIYIVAEK